MTTTSPGPGLWRVGGTIKNTSSTTAHSVAYLVSVYDTFGTTKNATSGRPSAATLAPGATATFTVTFGGLSAPPMETSIRARAT
jgi:hypothetical protein